MVFRKPYAFFIKMFKPIHLLLSFMIVYLIYLQNKILSFLNSYIYSSDNIVGQSIKSVLGNRFLYYIPLILIVLSMVILGIMFRKKKPFTFYIINIFAFIVVIVINIYSVNFLGVLEENVVSIKLVKLVHDLVLINMVIESISFIFFIVRGMGINFKKFNFDSEISKFNINESDKEEFEVDINVDFNERRRKRNQKLRYLKYNYQENKLLINCIIIGFIIILAIIIWIIINAGNKKNVEGAMYQANTISYGVDSTLMLNTDYKGNKLTDNYLIIVNTKIRSNISSNSLYLKDFSLKIGEAIFKPTLHYSKSLVDIGITYDESILPVENSNYLFVYEIPEKYINSTMIFSYNDEGNSIDIYLNPKKQVMSSNSISKTLNESITFSDTLGDIDFKISEFEIKKEFLLSYNFCLNNNECLQSFEHLRPSIDQNFDKVIMRLNVVYKNNSKLSLNTFYDFFSKFGAIYYSINGEWKTQGSKFEDIKSNKVNTKNNIYIGLNSEILSADSIKLVFNIRGSIYEYLLK